MNTGIPDSKEPYMNVSTERINKWIINTLKIEPNRKLTNLSGNKNENLDRPGYTSIAVWKM